MALAQTPRAAGANKGKFGHVLVVGGTFGAAGGKAGAPAMAALAALRAGAGLVTAAVPAPALAVVSAVAPELMTWPLEASAAGAISDENLAPERVGGADGGQDGAGDWAGAGAVAGDGEVCDRIAGGDEDSGGDRCGCAEYSGGASRCCWRSWPRDGRWC